MSLLRFCWASFPYDGQLTIENVMQFKINSPSTCAPDRLGSVQRVEARMSGKTADATEG